MECSAAVLVVFDAVVNFWPWSTEPVSVESYSGVQLLIICIFSTIAAVEVLAWLLTRHG